MRAVVIGLVLGVLNVIVIAIGFTFFIGREAGEVVQAVGLLPGLVSGALIGGVAHCCRGNSQLFRVVILACLSWLLVASFGIAFDAGHAIGPSCVPTLAGVIVLEYLTRFRPLPPLPVARTLSS